MLETVIRLFALVKYIVGESENCLDDLFEFLSTRFAEDSSAKSCLAANEDSTADTAAKN